MNDPFNPKDRPVSVLLGVGTVYFLTDHFESTFKRLDR